MAFTMAQPPHLNAQYVFYGYTKTGGGGGGTPPTFVQIIDSTPLINISSWTPGNSAIIIYDINNNGTDVSAVTDSSPGSPVCNSPGWVQVAARQGNTSGLNEYYGVYRCAVLSSNLGSHQLDTAGNTTSSFRLQEFLEFSGSSAFDSSATSCSTTDALTIPNATGTGADFWIAAFTIGASGETLNSPWDGGGVGVALKNRAANFNESFWTQTTSTPSTVTLTASPNNIFGCIFAVKQ